MKSLVNIVDSLLDADYGETFEAYPPFVEWIIRTWKDIPIKLGQELRWRKTTRFHHRSNFTRAGIVRRWPEYDINDKSWTERQVMNGKNYYRIYDCGTQKWLLTL